MPEPTETPASTETRARATSPFAPFRHRVFLAFWTGAFLSNIGTWMEAVGIGIYVTTETGQAGWTGLVAAAGFLPGGCSVRSVARWPTDSPARRCCSPPPRSRPRSPVS